MKRAKKTAPPKAPLRLEMVRAGDLKDNPANWRRHPPGQLSALRNLIADPEVGWAAPLLYNERTKRLIDGHARKRVVGPDEFVPVLIGSWSEEAEKKILATLDPLAGMAEADPAALQALLAEVDLKGPDLEALAADLEELLADAEAGGGEGAPIVEDEPPEPPEKAVSKTGDLWILGGHRLLCGDATNAEDVKHLALGQKPALLLTDPPYGINIVRGKAERDTERIDSSQPQSVMCGKIGGAKVFGRVRQPGGRPSGVLGGKGLVAPRVYPVIIGDDKPFDPTHLLDVADTMIIFGANHFAHCLPPSACWIVWDKNVAPDSTFSKAELAWVNRGGHVFMYRHTWSGLVREGERRLESTDRLHPTQKPVGLFMQILRDFPAEPVLDLYLGSGTTLIAAEQLGRRCYGMEIEPRYIDVAVKRWQTFTGKEAVLEKGGRTFEKVAKSRGRG